MRGKVSESLFLDVDHRITPACAGKSGCRVALKNGYKDHPRMCGEKHMAKKRLQIDSGSPPHVRGKAASPDEYYIYARITPACAGKRNIP